MPENKAKKATHAEMQARTNAVYLMLLNGATRAAILAHAAKTWEINTRQADVLIKRANTLFAQQAEVVRERELGKAIARHEDWIQQSLKIKDFSEARQNQKEISSLLALYTPQTVKIIAEVLTPQDAKLLAELLALLQARGASAGNVFAAMLEQIAQDQETDG